MVIRGKVILTNNHFEDAKSAVYAILDKLHPSLIYHAKEHTIDIVVPAAMDIAEKEGFSLEDKVLVCIAALFHDAGFVKQYEDNESIGAQFAEEYMKKSRQCFTEEQIKIVKDAIINTNMKNTPETKYAAVLRDADTSLLGSKNYLTSRRTLKLELIQHPKSALHEYAIDDGKWNRHSLNFMEKHKWFTKGAKILYNAEKQKNIEKYKKKYGLV